MTFDPESLREELDAGPLCFPVTHAHENFGFAEEAYREHVAWLTSFGVAAVFAAGGTGEFPALTPPEVDQVVRAAVAASDRPVIAPAGYGTAHAIAMARDAEEAGAAGVFLLPPYLATLRHDELLARVETVCAATDLPVVVQHEDALGLAGECPNLVGFPVGAPVPGVHTRLAAALPTVLGQLVNVAPRFVVDLHAAVRDGDAAAVHRKLDELVRPYLEIRDRGPGYAVAIVKAALTAVGRPAGPVRPPLADLNPTEVGELNALLEKANVA
jgi:5-dehydro-4-deoxyglucarate dehydratase